MEGQIRTALTNLRANVGSLAKELGIEPERDVVYAAAFSSIVGALIISELQESSKRPEGLTKDLLTETRALKTLTGSFLGLTGVVIVLTIILIVRPVS